MKKIYCFNRFAPRARFAYFDPPEVPNDLKATEAPEQKEELPSLKHLQDEVNRFEASMNERLDEMEKHYGEKKEGFTINRASFTNEADEKQDDARYKEAGMGPKAIRAVKVIVRNLALMREALTKDAEDRGKILSALQGAVSRINIIVQKTSHEDMYSYTKGDPLAGALGRGLEKLEIRAEEKKAEAPMAPEFREGTPEDIYRSSVVHILSGDDSKVDASALLRKFTAKGINRLELELRDHPNQKIILDRSTDGKSVRAQIPIKGPEITPGQAPTWLLAREASVYALDPKNPGTQQFEKLTYDQEQDKKTAENRDKFDDKVKWLEKAPVGSYIILNTEKQTKDGLALRILRKDTDGLLKVAIVEQKLETLIDEKGRETTVAAKDKDGRPIIIRDDNLSVYTPDTKLLIGAESPVMSVEVNKEETELKVKKRMDKLAEDIVIYMHSPQEVTGPALQEATAEIRQLALAHNITEWSAEPDAGDFGRGRIAISGGKLEWGDYEEPKDKPKSPPQYVARGTLDLGGKAV